MQTGQKVSLEQIRAFLEASDEVRFEAQHKEQVYAWVERILREQGWHRLGRAGRGLVRRYLSKMTGLSRAQITRLIQLYSKGEVVKPKSYRRHRFANRYSRADIELLASVDEAHETLSGPATQKILQREFHDFGDQQYERLAEISVAHLYRLRQSRTYRERRVVYQSTRPTAVAIGSGARHNRTGGRGTCVLTRSIKAIWMASKVCTTSTPSMRSHNGKWWAQPHTSAKPG